MRWATRALGERGVPLLILAGSDDACLPPRCSEIVFRWAAEGLRELHILPGEDHGVRSAAPLIRDFVERVSA